MRLLLNAFLEIGVVDNDDVVVAVVSLTRWLSTVGLNRISDGTLIALGAKSRLEYLNFGGSSGTANIGMRSFYGAPRISDVGACSYIGGGGESLRFLSFAGLNRLKDSAIYTMAKHCAQLVNLNLSGCANLTDKPFKELFKRCEFFCPRALLLTFC